MNTGHLHQTYDVIVVGAGHAGSEAAGAAAAMGAKTLMITMNMDAIAKMEDDNAKAKALEKMKKEEEAEKAAKDLEARIMEKELAALQLENILSENDQCIASRSEAECDAEAAEKLDNLNVTSNDGGEFTLEEMKKTKKKRKSLLKLTG